MSNLHDRQIKDLARLYESGQLAHAYIFFGDPNTGKASRARSLAAFIETGTWPETENETANARLLTDVRVFSRDEKGTIGIDAARSIKTFLSEKPFISPRKIAIVDGAEALTPEAQNALLKIAEEPSESSLIILVLPDPEILRPTLQSRFQKIYFPPPPREEMRRILKEKIDPMAEKFFQVAPSGRKDFVKELTEPEDFNFAAFLDSLIAHLAASGAEKAKNGKLWHAVLELRRMQDATNLSPRIQLMNLWTLI